MRSLPFAIAVCLCTICATSCHSKDEEQESACPATLDGGSDAAVDADSEAGDAADEADVVGALDASDAEDFADVDDAEAAAVDADSDASDAAAE